MSTASPAEPTAAADKHPRLPGEPTLPEARMHAVLPTAPVTAKVSHSELCSKGKSASYVRHVCVDVSGTPLEGAWLAGQSFGVVPPGTDANGKSHKVRLYSIASPTYGEDGEGKVLATTCKRLIGEREPQSDKDDPTDHRLFLGVCSNHVCDLRAGDPIAVAGPNGMRFLLPAEYQRLRYVLGFARLQRFGARQPPVSLSTYLSVRLIITAVVLGCHHFDQLSQVLGIGPSVLARRLEGMVESGLLRCDADRHDGRRRLYRLTPASRDLLGYIVCLSHWAGKHHLQQPSSILPIHACGHEFKPLVICSHCREPLLAHEVTPLYPHDGTLAGEPGEPTARRQRWHRGAAWRRGR